MKDLYKKIINAIKNNDYEQLQLLSLEFKSKFPKLNINNINENLKLYNYEESYDNNNSTLIDVLFSVSDINFESIKKFLDILVENGFDINSRDSDGHSLLEIAIKINKLKLVKYLIDEKGADFEFINQQTNLSPLYLANQLMRKRIEKFLLEKNAKIDPNKPLLQKISSEKLTEIFENEKVDEINFTKILSNNNYHLNLDNSLLTLDIPNLKTLDLSNLSLKNAKIIIKNKNIKVILDNSDFTNSIIEGFTNNLSFKNTNLQQAFFSTTYEKIIEMKPLNLENSKLLIVNELSQGNLIKSINKEINKVNNEGICLGLCVLAAFSHNEHDNFKDFIKQIELETNKPSEEFIGKINCYQNLLQKNYKLNNRQHVLLSSKNIISDIRRLNFKYNILSMGFKKNGHAILVILDKNITIIYDPNIGTFFACNDEMVNAFFQVLIEIYKPYHNYLNVRNIEELIDNHKNLHLIEHKILEKDINWLEKNFKKQHLLLRSPEKLGSYFAKIILEQNNDELNDLLFNLIDDNESLSKVIIFVNKGEYFLTLFIHLLFKDIKIPASYFGCFLSCTMNKYKFDNLNKLFSKLLKRIDSDSSELTKEESYNLQGILIKYIFEERLDIRFLGILTKMGFDITMNASSKGTARAMVLATNLPKNKFYEKEKHELIHTSRR